MTLLDDFTVKTALQRLLKRKRGMNFIWRVSFKNPVTIGALEDELRLSHNAPST
jgi:hypothetical protein